jgi:hypothetical protein
MIHCIKKQRGQFLPPIQTIFFKVWRNMWQEKKLTDPFAGSEPPPMGQTTQLQLVRGYDIDERFCDQQTISNPTVF